MRILVAPDKFKDSLGATEVAQAIADGLRDVWPDAELTILPVGDGGEGTAEVICAAARGEWHLCEVHDPLGRIVSARYGTIEEGGTAVLEMSEASGLWRLAREERDPLRGSTFGTGEMLLDAAKRGAREIIVGLGGSVTNDGGFGMARALGFRFFGVQNCRAGASPAGSSIGNRNWLAHKSPETDVELIGGPRELVNLRRVEAPVAADVSPA